MDYLIFIVIVLLCVLIYQLEKIRESLRAIRVAQYDNKK